MARTFEFNEGDLVRFLGYTAAPGEELPENADLLYIGEVYPVASIIDGGGKNENNFNLEVPNPDFDPKKRKSKTNPETLTVSVFPDEIELAEDDAIEGESEEVAESEEEVMEFTELEKGMEVYAVDEDGEIVAEGEVEKLTKISATIGGTTVKKSAGLVFQIMEAEGEEGESEVEDGEEVEGFEEEVTYEDVEKGEEYLFALDGENVVGVVTKKLKSKVTVDVDGDEVVIAAKDIQSVYANEAAEEEEEAPPAKSAAKAKTPAKTSTAAKGKATGKAPASKGKAGSKAKTPAKAKDEEEESKDIILTEDEEDEEILALVEGAEDLTELAQSLEEESNHTDWRLAGVLYHLKADNAYTKAGNGYEEGLEGFKEFCKQELSCGYRKAQYLIDIYVKFRRAGKGVEEFNLIGWTKAQVVAQYLTDENVEKADEMIEAAQEGSVIEMKGAFKESYGRQGTDERPKVKRIKFNFSLEEDAGVSVQNIFEQAKADLGKTNDSDAFEHIVTEWATEHLNLKPAKTTTKVAGAAKATGKATAKPSRRQVAKAG